MDKGYYAVDKRNARITRWSQSTIKMDKGYYITKKKSLGGDDDVAIHNKNGQGLLHILRIYVNTRFNCRNPQ